MERGRGYSRFFFEDAVKRLDSVFDYARGKFTNIFSGGKSDRQNTPQGSYRYIVGKGVEEREQQIYLLAENDPVKVQEYLKIPLIEYYRMLDNKLEQMKRLKEQNAAYNRTGIH